MKFCESMKLHSISFLADKNVSCFAFERNDDLFSRIEAFRNLISLTLVYLILILLCAEYEAHLGSD